MQYHKEIRGWAAPSSRNFTQESGSVVTIVIVIKLIVPNEENLQILSVGNRINSAEILATFALRPFLTF